MATKKRKERTPAEKAADFKKLAAKHASTALGAIERISKLARPGRYAWTPEQIKQLEKAFAPALGSMFDRLKNPPATGGKVTRAIFD